MNTEHARILRHALGLNKKRSAFRNYYVPGNEQDLAALAAMEEGGLVTAHWSGRLVYIVTEKGEKAAKRRDKQ